MEDIEPVHRVVVDKAAEWHPQPDQRRRTADRFRRGSADEVRSELHLHALADRGRVLGALRGPR